MSDMRRKLLPVFLEEAGRKILQLDDFLASGGGEQSPVDLEAAFRAAHTLKGTAALVQAEGVCSLSGRIEGMLEGYYERGCLPSAIEYEAMQLALAHLKKMIDAVAKGESEPAGWRAEAELALKLAMAMPGRRQLTEVLAHEESQDPFADDPEFEGLPESAVTEKPIADPFAEDPLIECESGEVSLILDPFAEDPDLEQPEHLPEGQSLALEPAAVDPFGDDPALELPQAPATPPHSVPSLDPLDEIADPFADAPGLDCSQETSFAELGLEKVEDPPETNGAAGREREVQPKLTPAEPAQEERFVDRMRKRIEKESALGTAERLAATLLRQQEGSLAERRFACCHFRVAEKDYYLPIENMVEIADLPTLMRLPLAPPVVRGLVNLRGRVLPVIDLAVNAGEAARYVAVRKLVIAEADGENLAFLADGIPDLSEETLGEKVDVVNFIDQFRAGAS